MMLKILAGLAVWLMLAVSAFSEPRSLLILHTNDLHDHVRKDYDDAGGLAYVAGYVASVRKERDDVLLVDAGDVMEKGDLVAFDLQSAIMYEAMGRIGYDAAAPGNHDDAYGDVHLEECSKLAPKMALLAINMLRTDKALRFPASAVFERNGLKLGVIGVFKPRDDHSLNLDETAAAVAKEALRLEPEVHLVVVVAHLGPNDCEVIARAAPNVDVFVSGHTHQALFRPVESRESDALIVQAGHYAEYVGRLELSIDDQTEEILSYRGELVEMKHDSVAPDAEMQAWFMQREDEISPHAADVVATIDGPLGFNEMAYLGAEGIRRGAGVDIGFCHMSQIIRDGLPVGPVDVNAIFRTGGQRGHKVVKSTLTGAEVAAYIEHQANDSSAATHWSGFTGRYVRDEGKTTFESDLDPVRTYSIAMPLLEWTTRYARYRRAIGAPPPANPASTEVSFTSAVVDLIRAESGRTLTDLAQSIERKSLGEPN